MEQWKATFADWADRAYNVDKAALLEKASSARDHLVSSAEQWLSQSSTKALDVIYPPETIKNSKYLPGKEARYAIAASAGIAAVVACVLTRLRRSRRYVLGTSEAVTEVVAISNCSTVLGRELAACLVAKGLTVFAAVRNAKDVVALEATVRDAAAEYGLTVRTGRIFTRVVESTDTRQIFDFAEAVRQYIAELADARTFVGLVNAENYSYFGPIEAISTDKWRLAVECNIIGTVAAIQAFAPLLRSNADIVARRVININSTVSSTISLPFNGVSGACHHALKAISDTARRELASFGVQVVRVVSPRIGLLPSGVRGRSSHTPDVTSPATHSPSHSRNASSFSGEAASATDFSRFASGLDASRLAPGPSASSTQDRARMLVEDADGSAFESELERNLKQWTPAARHLYLPGLHRQLTNTPLSIIFHALPSPRAGQNTKTNREIALATYDALTLRFPPAEIRVRIPALAFAGVACGRVRDRLRGVYYKFSNSFWCKFASGRQLDRRFSLGKLRDSERREMSLDGSVYSDTEGFVRVEQAK